VDKGVGPRPDRGERPSQSCKQSPATVAQIPEWPSSWVRLLAQTPGRDGRRYEDENENLLRALISITRSMQDERPGCKAAASGGTHPSSFTHDVRAPWIFASRRQKFALAPRLVRLLLTALARVNVATLSAELENTRLSFAVAFYRQRLCCACPVGIIALTGNDDDLPIAMSTQIDRHVRASFKSGPDVNRTAVSFQALFNEDQSA